MDVDSGNDSGIPNPIFESDDDKKLSTMPHNSVLEPVVIDESINNPTMREENKFCNALRVKWVTLQQYIHLVPLIVSMIIVVVILQIPTILYYTDPPSAEVTLLDDVDLERCSVSKHNTESM